MKSFLLTGIVFLYALSSWSQFGTLDNTFSSDGLQVSQLDSSDENGLDMKIQPDGKIVVVGVTVDNWVFDFIVTRYLPDGTPDSSFDSDGVLILDIDTAQPTDVGYCLDIQPDGKIVVAGTTYLNGDADFAVCRLNADGSLDNSFDGDGIRVISAGAAGMDNEVFSVKIDANNKILLGGYVTNPSTNKNFAVYRLNNDGSTDTTFGNAGLATTNFFGLEDIISSITLLQDGRIVAVGSTRLISTKDYAIAMYTGNGHADPSFSSDGKLNTDFGANEDIAWEVVQQGDGKLVVAGCSVMSTDEDASIARYYLNGQLDSTFNVDGKFVYDMGSGSNDEFLTLTMQPDNYIIAGGYRSNGTSKDLAMMRFDFDGNPDSSFGSNAIVITDVMGSSEDFIAGMEIQSSDLKLVVAGTSGTTTPDISVARYTTGMTIGIVEFGIDHEVLLYPNPVVENARINYTLLKEENISIYLQDIHGKVIENYLINQLQPIGENTYEIHLPPFLNTGVYFVVLSTETGFIPIKIIH